LKKDVLWRTIISLMLGFFTVILLQFIVTLLPNGQFRDILAGLVSVPATFITGIFFPDGKPTGSNNAAWDLILTVSKILICTLIWFIVLGWRYRRSQSAVI
jgi:hypothetical protein